MVQSRCDLRRLRPSLILAAVAILGSLNWQHPVVRLTDSWSNVAFLFACLVLPLFATLLAWKPMTGWYRAACVVIGVPWSTYSLFLALLVSVELTSYRFGDGDQEWWQFQTVTFGPSRVVAYHTNCGAPCALGVVLRQEMDIAPGVLLVREVWWRDLAETADIDVLPDGSVRVDGSTLSLRPHVYF